MADQTIEKGLYIHVPFCKSQCIYCGFDRIFKYQLADNYIDALDIEASLIEDERRVSTVYIGGGTPSSLSAKQLDRLLSVVDKHFDISNLAEYTIECNPDDVGEEFTAVAKAHGINRISMGVQSLNDEVLRLMHRRHSAARVHQAINQLISAGFDNISVDLIYGLPKSWNYNFIDEVDKFISLGISHLSAYALSYEDGTPLARMHKSGRVEKLSDDEAAEQYQTLTERMSQGSFDHYEISNFARENKFSRHNTLYWQRKPYFGLGPAACAFDGKRRYSNTPDVAQYIDLLSSRKSPTQAELLTDDDIFNEIVMLGMRTRRGIDKEQIKLLPQKYSDHFREKSKQFFSEGYFTENEQFVKLREEYWFVSDYITRKIFV